jgi:glucose/mannose-6-phosphate isomerase
VTAVLDDPAALSAADPGGMLRAVASLGDQLERGYAVARKTDDLPSGDGARNVVICGMGGSGIAGDVLRSVYADRARVPIVVGKGFELPEFVDHNTLVVVTSFSGNTEETLHAFDRAVDVGARVVAVSAGGELAARSVDRAVPHIDVPADAGQPRAALGYLAAAAIAVLDAAGLIPGALASVEESAAALRVETARLGPDRATGENEAKSIAAWLRGRTPETALTPVIWAPAGIGEAAAIRWKNQFNENAKLPAFVATLPELGHNEVEGWSPGSGRGFGLIVLRPGRVPGWADRRIAAAIRVTAGSGLECREVHGRDGSALTRFFALTLLGDYASVYLGILRGVDPTPVPVLTRMKEESRP